ncbi:MAG: hypothetical protein ABI768_03325 [Acidobacteriota bacterium]
MAGGGAARFGLAALLAPATPVPTPFPAGQAGCHRWKYALHWDRPARLATLKNALGNSVTIQKNFKAPGGGAQDDWPDPIAHSVKWTTDVANPGGIPNAGAWDYKNPPAAAGVSFAYDHDCDDFLKGGPACGAPKPGDPDGEHPGIWYTIGPADGAGEIVDWSWTLNYGYGKAPGNDIIYGLDPGPPLPVYDFTSVVPATPPNPPASNLGDSIPGITGTPLAFPDTWTTRGGLPITVQAVAGVGGANQPTWQTLLPSDVVGDTRNNVNWGLMTFSDVSVDPSQAKWCADSLNYEVKVAIKSDDSGDVTAIEEYLRLKYYSSGSHPGLSAAGGTPTKGAIERAGASLKTSWDADPKQRCARPWGVILCTDGLSNTCNTGAAPDAEWVAGAGNTPCENDVPGTDFPNYPPGAAEAVYNAVMTAGGGAAIIKPRTYAIGIAPEVGRCELNRIAYRGRTDAGAPEKDAGFLLYDPTDPPPIKGDFDLPHINPPLDESGGGPAPVPNRFRFDQAPPVSKDYAFFALDTGAIVDAFQAIVASTARGDYSTSAPVSGAAVSAGSIVLLPSTEYPKWRGHLRALDTTKVPASVGYEKWDAGDVLVNPTQPWHPTVDTRAIYTWDPADGRLIPVDTNGSNVADMAALAGDPAFTANVVDFIRGNDGTLTGKKRSWILGPAINSTPAVVGPPYLYKQAGNVSDHKPFEKTYGSRRALAWVGADDGMLHAFDFDDGTEILALLPPNLLANQIELFKNYPTGVSDTGQKRSLDLHIWGVANSFRFADVLFGTGYKTVGILTEGPAGDMVAALDVTHPYPGRAAVGPSPAIPADQNYSAAKPVEILWTKTSDPNPLVGFPGLHRSWSLAAIAPDSFSTSRMFFGAGINPASLYSAQKDATLFIVDPTDGTLNQTATIPLTAAPSPLVGQQTFADSVFLSTKVSGYLPDNVANLSVQADTDGRAWFTYGNFAAGTATSKIGIDLNFASGTTTVKNAAGQIVSAVSGPASPQPIYYSPSATGQGTTGCQIYALASGSLYETSPAVSGWNVNRSGAPLAPFPAGLPSFTPYLYIGVNPKKITDGAFAAVPIGKDPQHQFVVKQRIGGEVAEAIDLPAGDPALTGTPAFTKLGIHTQVTSSPIMIVDQTGKGLEQALFLLYDPDNGCNGISYVVILTFKIPANCDKPAVAQIQVFGAGPGAASGFTLTSDKLFASKSGVGKGQTAGLQQVDVPVNTLSGAPAFMPIWWRDVK